MKSIVIESSKGRLSAFVHDVTGASKLAILCPGFLDSCNYAHLVCLADDLTRDGYDVVRFDPTGTWDSEGTIADYTTTQYLIDIRYVLEHMLTKKAYPHVLLGGHSRGGKLSLLYAADDPRITKVFAIMSSARVGGNDRWKAEGIRTSKRDAPSDSQLVEFRVPYLHAEDFARYDALSAVEKIHVPICFFSGELDAVATPEEVRAVYEAANEPKRYVVLPRVGHDYRHSPDKIQKVNNTVLTNLREVS